MKKYGKNSLQNYYRMVRYYYKTLRRTVKVFIYVKRITESALESVKWFNWKSTVSGCYFISSSFTIFFQCFYLKQKSVLRNFHHDFILQIMCKWFRLFLQFFFVFERNFKNIANYPFFMRFSLSLSLLLYLHFGLNQHHHTFLHRHEWLRLKKAIQQFYNVKLMVISRLMYFGYELENMNSIHLQIIGIFVQFLCSFFGTFSPLIS